ncbi:MAG: T9SS type A sorting domain-containing protein, partial [Bacteroidia bacterium]
ASNRVQGNVTPAGTTSLTDTSLFLSQAPVYWGNMPWPGIGLPFTSTANAIPASMRYNSIGSKTICGDPDSLFSSMPSVLDATSSIPFNPYYVNGVLHFGSLDFSAPCNVQVIDLSGRLALNQDISAEVLRNGCFIGLNWAPGLYLVQLRSAEGSRVGRMLVPAH